MREIVLRPECWQLQAPFVITGHTFTDAEVLYVEIRAGGHTGRGEASGVYFLDEDGAGMLADAESVSAAVAAGASRRDLLDLLPAGGARNAFDCALWDLEAKQSGRRAWELADIYPGTTHTFETVVIDTPQRMAAAAARLTSSHIKIKLDDEDPLARVQAVRQACPGARLIVDVNQGWTFAQLCELAPQLHHLGVAMIEQPLPRGGDTELEGYRSPVPLGADESCLHTGEFEAAARRYQVINIKLDKTGGLTEALELARMAGERGLDVMVGNMVGTSLAMAPGFVLAQLCQFVDLDGALFLTADRAHPMSFTNGLVSIPQPQLWG
jgi:L-alanine-DL-glutamate epimerase-like enolase superfamily enzyme